ncbi:MAG TPA: hypothetical protein VMU29_12150 [Smithella sp.]|nr:hypothetical protein [Smithella sp.]
MKPSKKSEVEIIDALIELTEAYNNHKELIKNETGTIPIEVLKRIATLADAYFNAYFTVSLKQK